MPYRKIFDLETAVKMHIEGEGKWIKPTNNPVVNQDMELHIKVFETAPRDGKSLEERIASKEKERDRAMESRKVSDLWVEIQALQRLLTMVRMHDAGQALD